MKKILLMSFVMGTILISLSACTNEVEKNISTLGENENQETSQETRQETEPEITETKKPEQTKDQLSDTRATEETILEDNNIISNAQNPESNQKGTQEDFNLVEYLEENYPIEGIHYECSGGYINNETGRKEYDIYMQSDTQEEDERMTNLFLEGTIYEDEKATIIFDIAHNIISDIPKVNTSIHIYLISWRNISDDENGFLIVQDRAQDTLK